MFMPDLTKFCNYIVKLISNYGSSQKFIQR